MEDRTLKNFIIDIIFPRKCLGCNYFIESESDSFVCDKCLSGISLKSDFACAFCLSPVSLGKTCPFCIKNYSLDKLFVATSYEEPLVKNMVKTMKYKFIKGLANDIGKLMINYFDRKISMNLTIDSDSAVIVPVPLHKKRLNWRGFNQSEIIATTIGTDLGLVVKPALIKITNSKPQAEIKEKEKRVINSKGIFRCPKPELVSGKTILLIDDISTTGSTLDECARTLKSSGAKEVFGFVFARGDIKSA